MQSLFDSLCDKYGVEPDKDGECWIECPFCGKGNRHFSFSERGFNCFVCGESGGLSRLVGGRVPYTVCPPRLPKKKPHQGPYYWQTHAEQVLGQLRSKPNTELAEIWGRYRPFTVDSIDKYELGYGLLPASKCKHARLIYPARESGKIVAFRGRAIHCDCDKWLQSAGSKAVLWGREFLYENAIIIVCESPVDAMMAMQLEPSICAVASTGGAGVWRDEWTKQIAAYHPARVIVWFDNDLAGQANLKTFMALQVAWQQEHPNLKRLPRANGPWVANRLLREGIDAVLYRWANDAPPKADLSWALMR